MDVYINDIAAFLPNDPVGNDDIENVLGKIHNVRSRVKSMVLKNNGILTRHYAVDRNTGAFTHTNAQMTAEAIRRLKPYPGFSINDIECLCVGTSTPDVLLPGQALLVAGELKIVPCEAITTIGICLCGITSLKAAYANVALGFSQNAVSTGSELASSLLRSHYFEHLESDPDLKSRPILGFESEFLRWMLSDAAGAIFLSPQKNKEGISLRLDWIEHVSYAGQMDTCMYAGGQKNTDGTMIGWRQVGSLEKAMRENYFALKQDTELLGESIIKMTVNEGLARAIARRNLNASDIDWFLPHYSSEYFRDKVFSGMEEIGFSVPYEKWFTNLACKGNTGSASIYIMMEELFHSGKLQKGEKILCYIPESGRFSVAYMLLTAV